MKNDDGSWPVENVDLLLFDAEEAVARGEADPDPIGPDPIGGDGSWTAAMDRESTNAPDALANPMTSDGVDSADDTGATTRDGPDLCLLAARFPDAVERALSAIDAVERALRDKRGQIEDIRARHESLTREFMRLARSLDTVSADLAQRCDRVLGSLSVDPAGGRDAPDPRREGARD